jgi:hypothetical protein
MAKLQRLVVMDKLSSSVFIQISISYDNICSLTHKKCYVKSYHSDINHHMILNVIFSVLMLYGL